MMMRQIEKIVLLSFNEQLLNRTTLTHVRTDFFLIVGERADVVDGFHKLGMCVIAQDVQVTYYHFVCSTVLRRANIDYHHGTSMGYLTDLSAKLTLKAISVTHSKFYTMIQT